MNFDELDKKMRVYEQSIDQCILPDMYLVARLDGRSFSRLTKEVCDFEAFTDNEIHARQIADLFRILKAPRSEGKREHFGDHHR